MSHNYSKALLNQRRYTVKTAQVLQGGPTTLRKKTPQELFLEDFTTEEEIKRVFGHAITRKKGVNLLIRATWDPHRREKVSNFRQDVPSISGVKVHGMTMQFCIDNIEYQIVGWEAMKQADIWLKKASQCIPHGKSYLSPSDKLLFCARVHLVVVQ